MRQSCCRELGALVVLLSTCGALSAAPTYRITDLGSLAGSPGSSSASSINNAGVVVGTSSTADGQRGFVWQAGVGMSDLGPLMAGAHDVYVGGINDLGQVAGAYYGADSTGRSFAWQPGTGGRDLGDLLGGLAYSAASAINNAGDVVGHSHSDVGIHAYLHRTSTGETVDIGASLPGFRPLSWAHAINDSGQVTGFAMVQGQGSQAFLWSAQAGVQLLGGLSSQLVYSYATDINDNGQVVGASYAGMFDHAFLWQDGLGMIDLGDLPLGLDESVATAVNNRGQVVGIGSALLVGLGPTRTAFLWQPDTGMLDLNGLVDPTDPLEDYYLTAAYDTNDAGQIVGTALTADGRQRAVLLTPVPEPTTALLLLLGLPLVRQALRRRREPTLGR